MKKRAAIIFLCLSMLLLAMPFARAEAPGRFTLMVYMAGCDLESKDGAASENIRQMLSADIPSDGGLTLLIMTGGAKRWKTEDIPADKNCYFRIAEGRLERLETLERTNMCDAGTLESFIAYARENFPAERLGLVLWDHGGGPMGGFGSDEYYPRSEGLRMEDIAGAARRTLGGGKLSFVGFDACLMASLECAGALGDCAEYLIASEELEPNGGWRYDKFLRALAAEPGMETAEIGRAIADDFVEAARAEGDDTVTLSLIDLSKLDPVWAALSKLGGKLTGVLDGHFSGISRARQSIRSFGEMEDEDASDLVDAGDLARAFEEVAPEACKELKDAVSAAVPYARCGDSRREIAGLSVFFPYSTLQEAESFLPVIQTISDYGAYRGFVEDFTYRMLEGDYNFQAAEAPAVNLLTEIGGNFTGLFAPLLNGAAAESGGGGFWAGLPTPAPAQQGGFWAGLIPEDGGESPAQQSGFWAGLVSEGAGYYEAGEENPNLWGSLLESEPIDPQDEIGGFFSALAGGADAGSSGAFSLQLGKSDLDNLAFASASLLLPDGDAYIDLGEMGETRVDWHTGLILGMFGEGQPSLNGQLVSMTRQGEDRGVVPAVIDGEDGYLLIRLDGAGGGRVLGATEGYDSETGLPLRGWTPLSAGALVTPINWRVRFDGAGGQIRERAEGEAISVGAEGLDFALSPIRGDDYACCFRLTDLFGGVQYTLPVSLGG